jgi:putative membrane protein
MRLRDCCVSSPRPDRVSPKTTEVKETTMLHTYASVLANSNGWHHGHCWIVFPILLLLAAIAVALFRRRGRGPGGGADSPKRILAERFARGEISGEEYRDRLAQLG